MNFDEAIQVLYDILKNQGIEIDVNNYDGLIVKKLESSNTLDDGRTTNQTHIAITGEQMDIFPYLRSEGYFSNDDSSLKKYFVLQVPIRIWKDNISYLNDGSDNASIVFAEKAKKTFTSIVRNKRTDQSEQIQISLINKDHIDFIKFRKLLHIGTYMIIMKEKGSFLYDAFGIMESDVTDALREMNNHFYRDNSFTGVNIESLNGFYYSEGNMDKKELFKKFYFDHIDEVSAEAQEQVERVKEFQEEYPLQRLKELSLDEYALGKEGKEETLSYKLEFGKYRGIVGIGGGTSKKHGVFWSRKTNQLEVARQYVAPEQVDEKWNEFRDELYSYISTYGNSNEPLKRREKAEYSLLKGMDMVLTKLLFQYYPNKFVSIVANNRLVELLDYFEYEYNGLTTSEDLNFTLTKNLKNDFDFLDNQNLLVTGWILWRFLFEMVLEETEDIEEEEEIEPYSKEEFLNEVYISEEKYDDIVSALKMKKNIILEGAPRCW